MAHPCNYCGSECYCQGDLSDSVDSLAPESCFGCDDCLHDADDFIRIGARPDEEDDDENEHWLCSCGNFITNGLHCYTCGAEPPWGCPCSGCSEPDYDQDDDYFYDPLNDPLTS